MGTITSATNVSTVACPLPTPTPRSTKMTVWDIFQRFLKEPKNFIKTLGYSFGWYAELCPTAPASVSLFSKTMGNFKNFISATELVDKTNKVWTALKNFGSERTWTAARKVFSESTSLTNSFVDTLDFSSQFIVIKQEIMKPLKFINFAATFGGCLNGAAEEIELMRSEPYDFKKITLNLINLAWKTSYIALGLIGMGFMLTGAAFIPWVMLSVLTTALTFTVGGFFYERIVDPYGKHKDPRIEIENLRAENAHLRSALV